MREIEVSRFVAAQPFEIEDAVDPERVVEFEGSFDVLDVEATDAATVVTAGGGGLRMVLRFDPREDGLYYEQEGESGPFDEMWTHLGWEPENEGSRVSARSGVSLGLPVPTLTDRVAAWKRKGELERALDALADAVE
jgi:hypothetical protein